MAVSERERLERCRAAYRERLALQGDSERVINYVLGEIGCSQAKLAYALNMNAMHLGNIKRGRAAFTLKLAVRLLELLESKAGGHERDSEDDAAGVGDRQPA
ncbi:MAG: hypothetical protein WBC44_15160 [Planctomycetaceae bacterium]